MLHVQFMYIVHVDKPGCSLSIEGSKDSPVSLMINECVSWVFAYVCHMYGDLPESALLYLSYSK